MSLARSVLASLMRRSKIQSLQRYLSSDTNAASLMAPLLGVSKLRMTPKRRSTATEDVGNWEYQRPTVERLGYSVLMELRAQKALCSLRTVGMLGHFFTYVSYSVMRSTVARRRVQPRKLTVSSKDQEPLALRTRGFGSI